MSISIRVRGIFPLKLAAIALLTKAYLKLITTIAK